MNELIDDIKRHEGLRLAVYDDATGLPIVAGSVVVGNPTIGYGRLLTSGRGITKEEATYLFNNDFGAVIKELTENFSWFSDTERLNTPRADVVINMAYNMGVPTFKAFKKTIAAIEAGDWGEAARQILDSKAARDLPVRYSELAKQMRTGEHV